MATSITKLARERGVPIMDAKRKVTFEVKPKDIDLAKQRDADCCAFARASRRIHGVTEAHFTKTTGYLVYSNRFERYVLSTSMRIELALFDRKKAMAPGVYTMHPPSGSATLEQVRIRSNKRPGRHEPAVPPKKGNRTPFPPYRDGTMHVREQWDQA